VTVWVTAMPVVKRQLQREKEIPRTRVFMSFPLIY
jgi:hypothetical protein